MKVRGGIDGRLLILGLTPCEVPSLWLTKTARVPSAPPELGGDSREDKNTF